MKLLFFVVLLLTQNALGIKIPSRWKMSPIDMALYCKVCHHIVFETKRLVAPYETRTVKQCSKISGEGQRDQCLQPGVNDEGVILEAMENVCSIPFAGYMTKKGNYFPTRLLMGNIWSNKLKVNEMLSDEEMSFDSEHKKKATAMCANLDEDLQEVILHTFQTADVGLIDSICQREIGNFCGSTGDFKERDLYAMHPRFLDEQEEE